MTGKRIRTEERRNNFATCVLTDSEMREVEKHIGEYNRSYAIRMILLRGDEEWKLRFLRTLQNFSILNSYC